MCDLGIGSGCFDGCFEEVLGGVGGWGGICSARFFVAREGR